MNTSTYMIIRLLILIVRILDSTHAVVFDRFKHRDLIDQYEQEAKDAYYGT